MAVELACYECSVKCTSESKFGFRDECDSCGADIHCCLNCEFYETSSYNQCRETSADSITDKEKANFCDFFQPGSGQGAGNKKEGLLNAAEALFKK